ncbi:hypothetical protein ASF27_04460 [Methylobacterium sp. Leaf102]|uniref:hypothetical protein n=1 Tax=unclassified Methylobacterium TaxID=2615210 RepID=UPI0006FA7D33|nr:MULTISPECIES: hypothetical protein [unclassified Methylobacterium]KQP30203.1 hypothetical protein ASF27_04460 [Methylobacterium sp. Leaf102]KQP32132.1 hypothetical protein ASF25_04255 [Methylobacterium sp. Leaf100]
MSIAIDPTERRIAAEGRAPAEPKAPSRVMRAALIAVLGGVGLVGLSAGAYSMLSGLAGPPPSKVRIGRISADWPDLRDGVPALASSHRPSGPVPAEADPLPVRAVVAPVEAKAQEAKAFETKALEAKVVEAKAPETKAVEVKLLQTKPADVKAVDTKPVQVANIASPSKPARLPPIENAATVPSAPAVALVEKARTAPLVAPTPVETTRARATTGGTFAALPPASAEAGPKAKPAPVVARTKPAAKPVPAASEKVAAAQPAQAAEPEAEETEMFGMKVPSLAPVGRKLVEGVEALGNAVKRFPEQF